MRLLVALACVTILAGCVAPEPTYQTFVDQVPPCPESGLLTMTLLAENDREVAWAVAAFRAQGWDGAPQIEWRDDELAVADTCGQHEAVPGYTIPEKPLPRQADPAPSMLLGLVLMIAGAISASFFGVRFAGAGAIAGAVIAYAAGLVAAWFTVAVAALAVAVTMLLWRIRVSAPQQAAAPTCTGFNDCPIHACPGPHQRRSEA